MKIYREWLFEDTESGEMFLVETINGDKNDAIAIAEENFDSPHFIEEVSEFEAEMLGYDTY